MDQSYSLVLFNMSFERCINDLNFLDKFYDIFLSSSEEVSKMFKNTEMGTQKSMLMTSLVYMTRANNDSPSLLLNIADQHNRNNLNIKPELYSLWLDSLIKSAYFIDPTFDGKTETLWRTILQPGIDLMVSRYQMS